MREHFLFVVRLVDAKGVDDAPVEVLISEQTLFVQLLNLVQGPTV